MEAEITRVGNKITGAILILAGMIGISASNIIAAIIGLLLLILGFTLLFYISPEHHSSQKEQSS